ncbi:MAG TPA: NAD-dependent epimerase/dehydratase family protein [Vicinamibacterales bacterium]|nr:NAD-dependent epimerase/dehydratase family protein [Vicinamibacterales bacterium]
MNESVWITGVSGFTGRHLTAFLHRLPSRPRLIGLDLRAASVPHLDALHGIDIGDAAAIGELARAEPPTRVIHLAGLMPPAADADMWRANVGGTGSLLHGLHAARVPIRRIVSIGSAAEYSRDAASPLTEDAPCAGASAYGVTKVAQTLLARHLGAQFGFAVDVARPFNLLGPGLPSHLVAGSLVRQFVEADSGAVRVGNTHTARDFVDVRDAVRAYWLLASRDGAGGVFNVCSGAPTTIGRLVQTLQRLSGREIRIETDPARVRRDDQAEVYGSAARLSAATGWAPQIPLERSLGDMLEPA